MKTFIIAEAGSTWRIGKSSLHLAKAKKCIRIAKQCQADAVKFQWCSDPRTMERRRHVPKGSYDILCWPEQWLRELASECEQAGIEFMCTAFLPDDVRIIEPFVQRFKIASLEAFDFIFIDTCADYGKPLIISTGAMDYTQFRELLAHPLGWERARYLLCTAGYPTPLSQLNLAAIGGFESLRGLSDHSCDVLTGALAVACGAEIVEVHFRLDETRKDNPDFAHSLSPTDLKTYIANIRKAELMLGDGVKKVEACETEMLKHRVMA